MRVARAVGSLWCRFLLAAAVVLASAPRTDAGCTTSQDAGLVRRALNQGMRCADKRLRSGPFATCNVTSPPACAGTLVADAIAIAYGANHPPAAAVVDRSGLRDQLRCQKKIGTAAASYVGSKLKDLANGKDPIEAEARARKQLDKLPTYCLVDVLQDPSTMHVPSVGPQCAAAAPATPGAPADAAALRDCLGTLLGVWVDRYGPDPQPLRPNILFILTDDQRWDTTGPVHSPSGSTDVMARTRAELAAGGVALTQAFITTPLCCPSRASILSGQYAHRTGVYKNGGNNGGVDDFEFSAPGVPGLSADALPVWLQGAGYRTSLIGKYLNGYGQLWQSGDPPYVPPGWTEWRGMKNVAFYDYVIVEPDGLGGYGEVSYGSAESDYSTDVLREKAKAFISASVAAGEPFFLYLAFKAPHLPQIPAPRHDGLFQSVAPWRPPSWNEADVSDKPTWLQGEPLQDAAELDQIRIDQLEMLQAVDEAIGGNPSFGITGIMEHLRNLGVADDTLVVFLGDNGWLWGEHRLRGKNQPYEESIRSPMLVRYPKLAPLPRVETRFALNVDLAPTFAELAGVGVPIAQDGASLVRILDGTQAAGTWRADVLAEAWPGSHPWALVREAQWKYIEIPLTPGDPATAFERELYDLDADPYELANVADDVQNAARAAAMAMRLRELRPNWPVDSDPEGPDPAEDE
ncbi:MAG: sulfatase [Deltaproteobacteria bacterium]|nr:sulfatase [Deltaproteobacteria bacterium]